MNNKAFRATLSLVLFIFCVPSYANQSKVFHIGVLSVGGAGIPQITGFEKGLKDAGYVKGENLVIDYALKENYDELRPIAKAFAQKQYEVIVAFGGTPALIAKEAIQKIPIVFVGVTQPIESGLVKSLARPENNVTGVLSRSDVELHGKRLEILKEVAPSLRRVAVFYNARGENPGQAKNLLVVRKVGQSLGLKLDEKPIKSAADVSEQLSSLSKKNSDGIFVICSSIFRQSGNALAAHAIQNRLPFIGCDNSDVIERGALVSYEADRERIGHRAAWYVDRIFKGSNPRDLPVEAPTQFELVINLKTAKKIGLTIPPNVLARADRVIR
jgi:putative ABC transport system substrate-binding protein